ncbi:hypothetical protein DV515_00009525 [Chloebia gouldiae]|uniref:Uncharacterized protein n=1 Tax=Chloebia gouldiae TaxID=44316 RepID=A0A3L8SBM7_CHLGU|nr:hypothetical protein DV515_00009525 [Chloebia gouldiae]
MKILQVLLLSPEVLVRDCQWELGKEDTKSGVKLAFRNNPPQAIVPRNICVWNRLNHGRYKLS